LEFHVDDAWLDDCHHVLHVDFQDFIHVFFKRQDDSAVCREGTAGKTASGTARNDDDSMFVTVSENIADVLFVSGEENSIGLEPLTGCIVAVSDQVSFVAVNVLFTEQVGKKIECAGREHGYSFTSKWRNSALSSLNFAL